MNMFEKLTQQNRITPPFGHKVKLNNTTFNMTDVEEIKFDISFEKVIVEINDDQIASFSCGFFVDGNFSKNIIFFVTDNEGFDEKINLNVIFKNILYVLKKAYNRHQNY